MPHHYLPHGLCLSLCDKHRCVVITHYIHFLALVLLVTLRAPLDLDDHLCEDKGAFIPFMVQPLGPLSACLQDKR